MAPLQKRLEGVSELSKHKDDKVPLKQASKMPKSTFSFCVWLLGTWGLDLGLGLGLRLIFDQLAERLILTTLKIVYTTSHVDYSVISWFESQSSLSVDTRFLVDGSHWTSKKKFREDSCSGEHLGCSSLSKLSKSLSLMTYSNFMNHLITFFAINNLHRMGKI